MQKIIPNDVAVIVFTSAKNLRERALSVQKTWLRSFAKGYLVGGYAKDSGLKMINLPNIGEDYFSATPKQFLGLKAIYEKYSDAKWFYVLGCDGYVYTQNLCDALSNFDWTQDLYVGGNFLKRTVLDTEFFFPAGGPGFAMSNSLVKKLIPHIEYILKDIPNHHLFYEEGACDAAMGYYLLKLLDIKPNYVDGFYTVQPYRYPGDKFYNKSGEFVTEPLIEKPIAFHTLTLREMYILSKSDSHCNSSGNLPSKKPNKFHDSLPKERNLFDKIVDKCAFLITRKLKTKKIINTLFEKIYGSTKVDSKYCIVNIADGLYVNGQNRLKESLIKCGYKGDFLFYSDIPKEWPSHNQSPMGYKPLLIREAIQKGYAYVMWVDANMVCVRNPKKMLKILRKKGYFIQCEYAVPFGEWCSDSALKTFNISRDKSLKIVETHSGYVGIASENEKALKMLDQWCDYALDQKTFRGIEMCHPLEETNRNFNEIVSKDKRVKGHRHDQTALSYLVYKYGFSMSHIHSRNFQSLTPNGENHYGKSISFDCEFIQSRDTKTPNYLRSIDKWGNHKGRKKIKFVLFSFLETFYKRAFFVVKDAKLKRIYKKIKNDY